MILVLAILAIGTYKMPPGLATIGVGMLVISVGLSLGGTTGYAINPARDLDRASYMPYFLSNKKAIQTGAIHGFQSSAQSSVAY